MELGGNLIDVCGIGIYSALQNTILPKLEIESGDNNEVEIMLSDDPLDGVEIDFISPLLTVTIAKLGNRYIIDPSDEEEAVSNVKLCVAIKVKIIVCFPNNEFLRMMDLLVVFRKLGSGVWIQSPLRKLF